MPFTDDQHEYPLPTGGKIPPRRKSAELLPRYFRTITNKKFLNATLDQLTQPGVAEKLAGYFGRDTANHTRLTIRILLNIVLIEKIIN